jgi:hypothetical protein
MYFLSKRVTKVYEFRWNIPISYIFLGLRISGPKNLQRIVIVRASILVFWAFRKNLNPRKSKTIAKISKKNSESHWYHWKSSDAKWLSRTVLNYIRKVKCHSNSQRDFQGLIKIEIPYMVRLKSQSEFILVIQVMKNVQSGNWIISRY